jgi:hypothetical protein
VRSPPLEKRGRHAACQAVHVIECEVEGAARAQVDVAPGRPRWHVHVHVVACYAQLARRGQAAQQHLARSRHTLRPCQDFPFRLSCWRVGCARCYAKAIVVPRGSQGKSMSQAVQAADGLFRAPSFRAASIGSSVDSALDSAVNVAVDAEQNQRSEQACAHANPTEMHAQACVPYKAGGLTRGAVGSQMSPKKRRTTGGQRGPSRNPGRPSMSCRQKSSWCHVNDAIAGSSASHSGRRAVSSQYTSTQTCAVNASFLEKWQRPCKEDKDLFLILVAPCAAHSTDLLPSEPCNPHQGSGKQIAGGHHVLASHRSHTT